MIRSVRSVTVTVAAASLLAVGLAAAPASAAEAATPTELFISEYVEGSSTNKALEIYNPTEATVELAGYQLGVYFNGGTSSTDFNLTGSVTAGDTFVFADNVLAAVADQTTGSGLWNGDDAIVLRHAGTVIDSIGQVGFDPGSQWGADLTSTADNTLRRAASVCVGDTDPSNVFDPAAEWVGFAQDTFDGLGAHTATCGEVVPGTPVINEFSASTTGTDVEYVELLAEAGADLSPYVVLEIEGDATSPIGVVDEVITLGTADADGRLLVDLPANALENGTISLLLVSGFTGAAGDDLDADDDGVLEFADGVEIVDAVAVNDGGAGDVTYGGVTLGVSYDGLSFAPGGASRIPDGTDTDTTGDWVRNDFDLAGYLDTVGTPVEGEALNTPGAENEVYVVPPADAVCEAPTTMTVGAVQGSGDVSPVVGQLVDIEGVVVGDFQATGQYNGYYLQDAGDGDAATSDGIFVYAPGGIDVAVGDEVHVVGTVSEFFGMTEVTVADAEVCANGVALPPVTEVMLPAGPDDYEALEGMYVTFPQTLAILETFEYARYGTMDLGLERQMTPTAVVEPGSPEFDELVAKNLAERITLDDGRFFQNPDPAIHPNGEDFTLDNRFRGGDLVTDITGVLDHRRDGTDDRTIGWRVQPTEGADFEAVNLREENPVPEVGGTTTVASFNVLNYFTTLGSRGANDAEEFERQEAKIVAAIAEIDADIVGLIEIENNGAVAVGTLVEALNDEMGDGTYAYIATGPLGTDVITTALIYKPAEVTPVGDHAVLDSTVDPRFNDDHNRPALAQTFTDLQAGGEVTVVVNHLKSKGSACAGDPDLGDGAGNCNLTRTAAAAAMADWLAGDPTGQETDNVLIIGDLNSYDKEDPIDVLLTEGYSDLLFEFQGEEAYSYVFDGQLGYLDYALSSDALTERVTGAEAWHINSDEPNLIDYDTTFKEPAQDALYAPDEWRSSDHDPVIVGLDLDVLDPHLTVTPDPAVVFPPNTKWHSVTFDIVATDNVDTDVTVEIISVEATGHKAEIREISEDEVEVRARQGAVYTVTFEATDDSGNTTTEEVIIRVGP